MNFQKTIRATVLPATTLAALLACASARADATLKGEYFFGGDLTSTQSGGPTLTEVDPIGANSFVTDTVLGDTRTVFHWDGNATPTNQQAGFFFNTSGVITPNSYSIQLIIKFDDGNGGWRRITDVRNRADDTGFYVNPSNGLEVFPTAGNSNNFVAGEYRNVILVNDNGHARGYLDGGLEFTTNDTLMDVDGNNIMSFFLDNVAAGGQGEFHDGDIALLRVYDGILIQSQIDTLSQTPFESQSTDGGGGGGEPSTPEPASLGILAIGAAALIWRRR